MNSPDPQERLGRLDDEAEDAEPSSTTDGPAAEGDYDPAQGSPEQPRPAARGGSFEEGTDDDTGAGGAGG